MNPKEQYTKETGYNPVNSETGEIYPNYVTWIENQLTTTIDEAITIPKIKIPTDADIVSYFTTEHKSWKEAAYKKVRNDRVFGAKWMRDLLIK